ncbi:hypothetical protein [Streptomyces chartreusis]
MDQQPDNDADNRTEIRAFLASRHLENSRSSRAAHLRQRRALEATTRRGRRLVGVSSE